jgi:ATP-dependent Clp protease adaptor protein ClpS
MAQNQPQGELDVVQKTDVPRRYKVILLNDDFTPMNFVTFILQRYFAKTTEEAEQIMLNVHQQGSGLAGVYTREVAEMKVHQVNGVAKQNEYPFKTIMEAE